MVLLQITGLTNNSYFDGAHEVRHCVRKHPDLGHLVLEVAKVYTKEMNVEKPFSVCIPVAKAYVSLLHSLMCKKNTALAELL